MKKIDINNEEQILKQCDFDYFYQSEKCSSELCMFFNDLYNQDTNFNKKQALIDLGRIAITLNEQDEIIKELESELVKLNRENDFIRILYKQSKQTQNSKAIAITFNEQDENTKELKKEIVMWKSKAEHMLKICKEQSAKDLKKIYDCVEEIDQLKLSQNQKAIEVLDDVKYHCMQETETLKYDFNTCVGVVNYIDNQITELRGGK